ncbi:Uncharacterised protein [Legionella quateirensis]|uniref:Tetratricopeptide repeat protein n=1 Tax=Legionella quateirensis TaxID=45072 RepID=A0A378KVA4_9GAMM|nr:hypothetical protein Lqua_2148 [Legionella quateirensis]STY18482.1 Uncharacterised protein [Legionella quateirensis]
MIRKLLVLLLAHSIMNCSYADSAGTSYWRDYSKAKELYNQNKFSEALRILEQLEQRQKNYNIELTLGDTYSALGYLQKGLDSYNSALYHGKLNNNIVIERVALFKIGKLQTQLKDYESAFKTYQTLLSFKLDKEDYSIAKSGIDTAQEQINIVTNSLIKKGNQFAEKEEPAKALNTYQQAYGMALFIKNDLLQRIALFKIARTQLWLLNYEEAIKLYQRLLSMCLNDQDSRVAKTGLEQAEELKKDAIIKRARELIDSNQGQDAFRLIHPYLISQESFQIMIIAAQSMAIMDKPKQSFTYYQKAYFISKNATDHSIALMGMIKMQLALNNRTVAEHYLFLLDKMSSIQNLHGIEKKKQEFIEQLNQLKIDDQIKEAEHYLELNNGQEMYNSIKWYLDVEKNPLLYRLAAESMAMMNQPQFAFNYYQLMFNCSSKPKDHIIALFGMAKMQFWMARYVRAKNLYKQLLTYDLSNKQHELALAGLVKSLAYYDRPRLAYSQIPSNQEFTTPEMVIASSQASSWSDWSDLTHRTLNQNRKILDKVDLKSGLGRDLRDLAWQTNLVTWPNVISPSYYRSVDSETFSKSKTTLDYRHYWSQQSQTVLGPEYIKYTQNYLREMNAKGFYVGQIIRSGRYLILDGTLEPMEYRNGTFGQHDSWSPFLWHTSLSFSPNDYIKLKWLGQKEVLETFPAFNNRITTTLYGTNITLSPLPYLSLDSSYSHMRISDNNERNGYYLAPSLIVNPDLGLTATAIVRGFTNQFRSRNYFSPAQYQEKKILVKLGRKLGATWHYYLDGGLGRQYIKNLPDSETNSSPTYQWGMGINGPLFKTLFVTVYYVNTHQASAFIDSPGYAMQYGGISLNLLV